METKPFLKKMLLVGHDELYETCMALQVHLEELQALLGELDDAVIPDVGRLEATMAVLGDSMSALVNSVAENAS